MQCSNIYRNSCILSADAREAVTYIGILEDVEYVLMNYVHFKGVLKLEGRYLFPFVAALCNIVDSKIYIKFNCL